MRILMLLLPSVAVGMGLISLKLSSIVQAQDKAIRKVPIPELVEKQNAWFNWQTADRATDILERILDSDKDLPFLTSGQRNEAKEIVKQFNDRYRSPGTPTDKT